MSGGFSQQQAKVNSREVSQKQQKTRGCRSLSWIVHFHSVLRFHDRRGTVMIDTE
jgi:hypothetical protein